MPGIAGLRLSVDGFCFFSKVEDPVQFTLSVVERPWGDERVGGAMRTGRDRSHR